MMVIHAEIFQARCFGMLWAESLNPRSGLPAPSRAGLENELQHLQLQHVSRAMQEKKEARKKFFDKLGYVGNWLGIGWDGGFMRCPSFIK